jgi:hypothetical protein
LVYLHSMEIIHGDIRGVSKLNFNVNATMLILFHR